MKKKKTLGMGMRDLLKLTLDKDILPLQEQIHNKKKEIEDLDKKIKELEGKITHKGKKPIKDTKQEKAQNSEVTKLQNLIKTLKTELANTRGEENDGQTQGADTDGIYKKGLAFLKEDKLAEALQMFAAVLYFDPDHLKSLNNIGVIFFELGLQEYATQKFKKILKLDPGNKTAVENLALLDEMGTN